MAIYGSDQHTSVDNTHNIPHIQKRWAMFAFTHYFSNDLSEAEALDWFKRLSECETAEYAELLLATADDRGPTRWAEYERMDAMELIDAMVSLACRAREVELRALPQI